MIPVSPDLCHMRVRCVSTYLCVNTMRVNVCLCLLSRSCFPATDNSGTYGSDTKEDTDLADIVNFMEFVQTTSTVRDYVDYHCMGGMRVAYVMCSERY